MAGVANKVTGTLSNIPFESIIGGPLSACINAQADAAMSTVNFIKSVGLTQDEDGVKAVYVVFSYVQNGRRVNISVPLLTIVPIPYIAIHNINIDFKVAVSGVESASAESSTSDDFSQTSQTDTKKGGGWLTKRKTTKMNTSISSKRDSKSTRDSSFSVEATLDVSVQAGQEAMPAGMSKILELLGGAVDVVATRGELTYDGPYDSEFDSDGKATKRFVVARYKGPDGIYDTTKIKCSEAESNKDNEDGDAKLFYFPTSVSSAELKVEAADGNPEIKRAINF